MKTLYAKGTNDSPEINLDHEKGCIFMGGSSLPENVLDLFNPILVWLEEYAKTPNPNTNVDFRFDYLNTASSHMVMRIIEKCMNIKDKCESFKFNWGYHAGDYDMRDFGYEIIEEFNYPIIISTIENL